MELLYISDLKTSYYFQKLYFSKGYEWMSSGTVLQKYSNYTVYFHETDSGILKMTKSQGKETGSRDFKIMGQLEFDF